jgi:hypothetical protein
LSISSNGDETPPELSFFGILRLFCLNLTCGYFAPSTIS